MAFEYLNKSASQRMPHYNKCSLNDTDIRTETLITYMDDLEAYIIKLDLNALEKRINQKVKARSLKCFIQFFDKKSNFPNKSKNLIFNVRFRH